MLGRTAPAPSTTAGWHSVWQGHEIVVLRDEAPVDRIDSRAIERVIFVYQGEVLSAGDLPFAVVELADEWIVLPAATGFAGRVHFERQSFWDARACIYWVEARHATLPAQCKVRSARHLLRAEPRYLRLAHAELQPWIERWPLEGPQSLDQRRWHRIERERDFTSSKR